MIYIIILLLSIVLTILVRKIAIKKAILDIPNERSSHSVPTPRGGGVAIAVTWFMGISYLFYTDEIDSSLFYALISGVFLVGISFIDDIKSQSPGRRMFFQILSSVLALYFLGGLEKIDLGFYVFENVYILTPIALVAIVWFINLFNFLDGIDGYEASEVIFICVALFFLFSSSAALVLAVACLGFLFLNWQKAKIFMGDVGSTLLGFNIIVFAIYFQNTETTSIFNVLILSSVFWFDATYTLFRRWKVGDTLSEAHKKHGYQRIVQSGFSHQKTVLFSIVINLIGFGLVYVSLLKPEFVLLFFAIDVLLLFLVMDFINKKKTFK